MLILNSSFSFFIFILHLWFPLKSTFYLKISPFTCTISGTVCCYFDQHLLQALFISLQPAPTASKLARVPPLESCIFVLKSAHCKTRYEYSEYYCSTPHLCTSTLRQHNTHIWRADDQWSQEQLCKVCGYAPILCWKMSIVSALIHWRRIACRNSAQFISGASSAARCPQRRRAACAGNFMKQH